MRFPFLSAAFVKKVWLITILVTATHSLLSAQVVADSVVLTADEIVEPKVKDTVYRYFPAHSPVKATWMSAALPGLGQYYNRKYWKIPIVYAGFGVLGYFIASNKHEYDRYRNAYAESYILGENAINSNNELVRNYTSEQLLSQREYYQSNLELSYIITVAWYLVQVVDAVVDAHLYNFDVSDDLSVGVQPHVMHNQAYTDIKLAPMLSLRWQLPLH